ncbi:hypothetical protein Q1695_003796 [Nippostrongylus brasiliensis]|nr:hypothetical protein Q1695_003796 [Nippostrongylus brasiliensis]
MWTDKVSQQILYVTNNTDKKQALKMKCSNNNLFKINPVFATIERGKSVLVIVRKSAGAVTVEKIQVLTKPTDDNDPQKAFAKKDVEPLIRDIVMGPKK